MKKIATFDSERDSLGVLFRAPQEKGVMEWRIFDVISGGVVDMRTVKIPRKAFAAKGSHNAVYISYRGGRLRAS